MMLTYLYITGAFVMAMVLSYCILPRIIMISYKKNLFDEIDERKIHTRQIPRLGGVSFPLIVILTLLFITGLRCLYGSDFNEMGGRSALLEFIFLICGMMMLLMIGIADDLIGVNYRSKLVTQVIAASFFPLSGLYITNLGGLFNIYEIPAYIGMPLTVFMVVYITNAINLIDGIDGLASEVAGMALTVVGILFLIREMWIYAMLSFIVLGLLIPFFYFNVFGKADHCRKLFMGDTGSMTLGYLISFLAIHFCMDIPGAIQPEHNIWMVIAFSAMIIPCFDVVRVVLVRLRNKKSPFLPDKNHIHHKFLMMGYSPAKSLVSILLMDLLFIVGNIILTLYLNIHLIVIFDVVCWIGCHLWLNVRIHRYDSEMKFIQRKQVGSFNLNSVEWTMK